VLRLHLVKSNTTRKKRLAGGACIDDGGGEMSIQAQEGKQSSTTAMMEVREVAA
jgi:hypothetical protein